MSVEDQDLVDNMFAAHDIDIPYDPPIHDADANDDSGSDKDEFSGLTNEMNGLHEWYVGGFEALFRVVTSFYRASSRLDTHDRRDHNDLQMDHWEVQMPRLVDTYLAYRE
jgi:hypothetical protein